MQTLDLLLHRGDHVAEGPQVLARVVIGATRLVGGAKIDRDIVSDGRYRILQPVHARHDIAAGSCCFGLDAANQRHNLPLALLNAFQALIEALLPLLQAIQAPSKAVHAPIKAIQALSKAVHALINAVQALIKAVQALIKAIQAPIEAIQALIKAIQALVKAAQTLIEPRQSRQNLIVAHCHTTWPLAPLHCHEPARQPAVSDRYGGIAGIAQATPTGFQRGAPTRQFSSPTSVIAARTLARVG
ncbi:MAG TPA: hypothetical protein VMB34_15615, partial [Acetobacteraceae bacterium]|nr:hypothetical protein [Acetobacteraceae bacterium]